MPLLAFEAQLLDAMNSPNLAADFGIALGGYHFCGKSPDRIAALLVEFPMSGIKIDEDKKKKEYRSRVDTMILLRDANGIVLRRLSRVYDLDGALDQLEATRKQNISFVRQISVPPGEYVLEAVVRDRLTGKAAVRKDKLVVGSGDAGRLQVSSLVLSKNAIPASAADKADKEN